MALIGCEGVEFSGFERFLREYDDVVKCLEDASVQNLHIGLIGPNLGEYAGRSNHTMIRTSGLKINIFTRGSYYHDFQQSSDDADGGFATPDILVLYNPGLWGYDSWIPTLESFKNLHNCAILVTSFTLEEGEDDSDTIESSLGSALLWQWEVEQNPYASTVQLDRSCAVEGRLYFDNFAWQCFSITN
jgi:hypothetical protein